MLPGIQHFRTAQAYLANQDIEQAAQHVWKAMFYSGDWPKQLQQQADALLPLLFKWGPIAWTIRQLSPEDCELLHRQLSTLVQESLQLDGSPDAAAAESAETRP